MLLRACCFARAVPSPGFITTSILCLLLGIHKGLVLPRNIPLLRGPRGNLSREMILSGDKISNVLISRLANCKTQIWLCLGWSIPDRHCSTCLPRRGREIGAPAH